MEINPVLEVNKAKQNNTVMTFQIYGNKKKSQNTSEERYKQSNTNDSKGATTLWNDLQKPQCQVETMNHQESTSSISSVGFTPNGLAIDDNGLRF